jgi:hypothetical protein
MMESSNHLIGEDRSFGGNELYVDLLPKTCWGNNLRQIVKNPHNYQRLVEVAHSRVDNKCETCQDYCNQRYFVEGRWDYDQFKGTRTLTRIMLFCVSCYYATHLGLATIKNRRKQAINHLKRVNKVNDNDISIKIHTAFDTWRNRSLIQWKSNVDLLDKNGFI